MKKNFDLKQKKRQYSKAKRRIELGVGKPDDNYTIEYIGRQLNYAGGNSEVSS